MVLLKGVIRLQSKKGNSNRFLSQRCPWVYSNELQPTGGTFQVGDWVALESDKGEVLGYGFYNPHSLIAFRAFERAKFKTDELAKTAFFKKLDLALDLRVKVLHKNKESQQNSFRLCFGESDGLPGLIIDLYESEKAPVAVIQCHAAGADMFIPWAKDWLLERLKISCGVVRNDLDVRDREKAQKYTETWGALPSDVFARENGLRFYVDILKGQKTGFFYDQRDNRSFLAGLSFSGLALDGFSYVGSWGLNLAKNNPKLKVHCLDISEEALGYVKRNAEANGLSSQIEIVCGDYFKEKELFQNDQFEVVVCDPPSMSASKANARESERAHERCFYRSLGWLRKDGYGVFSSCSYHLSWENFLDVSHKAAAGWNRELKMFHFGSQASDHPVLSSLPESRYLKSILFRC